MSDLRRTTYRVELVLETLPVATRNSPAARLALMYAEAIDDDDEHDATFRFSGRLQVALESLGLGRGVRVPPVPRAGARAGSASPGVSVLL